MSSSVSVPHPQPRTDLPELIADIENSGYCIIADALDAAQVSALRRRLRAQADAERAAGLDHTYQADAEGDHINQWVYALINKGDEFLALPMHPTVRGIAGHVLGKEHLLSSFDAHITYPSNKEMPLHTDQWWMPQPSMPGTAHIRVGDMGRQSAAMGSPERATTPITPPMVVNAMWMLSDFTAENGATRLMPGSHLSGMQPDPGQTYATATVEAPAGSVLIWEGRTWHAAGLNISNSARYGVVTLFSVPTVRQLTNFTYGLRPELKSEVSPEMLDLLGFRPWESYGMTSDPTADVAQSGTEMAGRLGD